MDVRRDSAALVGSITEYLLGNRWSLRDQGGLREFSKPAGNSALPVTDKLVHADRFVHRLRSALQQQGLAEVSPLPILRRDHGPIFPSAGIDRALRGARDATGRPVFVLQPCIRTQWFDSVEHASASFSSFVSASTLATDVAPDGHVRALDAWLSSLSSLGIYVGRLKLKLALQPYERDGTLGQTLHVFAGPLELGDAVYVFRHGQAPELGAISDIGFGLERVLAAACGSRRYAYSVLPPFCCEHFGFRYADALRTLALMAGAGVSDGASNHGFYYRKLLKRLIGVGDALSIPSGVRQAFRWWTLYESGLLPLSYTIGQISIDLERHWAGSSAGAGGKSVDRELDFFKRLEQPRSSSTESTH